MTLHTRPRISAEEYLARERAAETKSEYVAGEVFAMSGGTYAHAVIIGNVTGTLNLQLRGRNRTVCPNDLRVAVPTGLYTYPDIAVVCGEPRFSDEQKDTLLNPTLIVEVLSKSTEDYDRGRKFEHYRTIASLAEYVLVAQDKVHVEHFARQPGTH